MQRFRKKSKSLLQVHKVSMRAQVFSCVSATYGLNFKHFPLSYSIFDPWVFHLTNKYSICISFLTIFMNSMHSVFKSLLYGIIEAFIMIKVVGHSLRAFGAHFFANKNGLQCSFFVDTLLGYPVRWSNSKVCLLAIFTMR